MGADVLDAAALTDPRGASRFARWPAPVALAALAAFLALLVAAMIVPTDGPGARSPWSEKAAVPVSGPGKAAAPKDAAAEDEDIALYDDAIDRVAAGQNYYDFIVSEQRRRGYPVHPEIAVRMPTLAYINAALGKAGQILAAMSLIIGVMAVWWRRLGEGGRDDARVRRMGTALAFAGVSLALNRHYFSLHELWAGGLIALSFGLHRFGRRGGGRWGAAFVAAALALAIRELALPYVLLMAAFALWQRNWRESAAWIALVVVFFAGLAWHLSIVSRDVLPSDLQGPSWLALRGLTGWLANVVQSSNLRWLPHFIAGPVVILMTFGWLGWRGRAGLFGFLLCAGYGLAFMVAGRWNNFYWGAIVTPVLFPGLAFAPRALAGLVGAARSRRKLIACRTPVMQKPEP